MSVTIQDNYDKIADEFDNAIRTYSYKVVQLRKSTQKTNVLSALPKAQAYTKKRTEKKLVLTPGLKQSISPLYDELKDKCSVHFIPSGMKVLESTANVRVVLLKILGKKDIEWGGN